MNDFTDRRSFLRLAVLFEGGLLVVALALWPLLGVDLLRHLHWSSARLIWGIAATAPLFGLFLVSLRFRPPAIARIHEILLEFLGAPLAACRWHDLIGLALLAGVSEEVLFRGVLQIWLQKITGPITGLLAAGVIFGLAHAVTPTYAILAAVIGVYLGALMNITGEPNLIAPIVTHALYDYLAFLVVIRMWRTRNPVDEVHVSETRDEFGDA